MYAFDGDWDVEIHATNGDEVLFNKSPSSLLTSTYAADLPLMSMPHVL
jgi:hypothetical protein